MTGVALTAMRLTDLPTAIARGSVTCWAVRCEPPPSHLLTLEESALVAAIRAPQAALRKACSFAARRLLLAAALGIAPADVRYRRAPGGKPLCLDGTLPFSVASSGGMVLVALGGADPLGVDVEVDRPAPDGLREVLHPDDRHDPLAAWVRREAAGKALGIGLLDQSIAVLAQDEVEISAAAITFCALRLAGHQVALALARPSRSSTA